MRMKQSVLALYLPFVVAFVSLSIPQDEGETLKRAIGERLASVWQRLPRARPQGEVKSDSLDSWMAAKERQERQVKRQAVRLFGATNYLVGKVIFRSPHTWNGSLWVNVGNAHNPKHGPPIIAKNSPVLSGDAVAGVVDYVGETSSLVRLITDASLVPSVRVARYAEENLAPHIEPLIGAIEEERLPLKESERTALLWLLQELMRTTEATQEPIFLAKGELQGHGEPLWRTGELFLRGVGFNYDSPDHHGPARDLRTGEPFDPTRKYNALPAIPLIQVGDSLVTSGMDGIFPEGLRIATVQAVAPLQEGAYSYEIVAKPAASDLADLSYLFILPPLLETS